MAAITIASVRKSTASMTERTKVDTIVSKWNGLVVIGAELAHARGELAHALCKVVGKTQDEAAELFTSKDDVTKTISGKQVGNLVTARRRWVETTFGEDYIGEAYTLVTATSGWGNKWNKPEGKDLMKDLIACKDDATRLKVLKERALPGKADKSDTAGAGAGESAGEAGEGGPATGADLVAALTFTLDLASKVTLTDDESKVAATILADLVAALAAPVAVKA